MNYTEIIFTDEQELITYLESQNMNDFVFVNPSGSKSIRTFNFIQHLVSKNIEQDQKILELQNRVIALESK